MTHYGSLDELIDGFGGELAAAAAARPSARRRLLDAASRPAVAVVGALAVVAPAAAAGVYLAGEGDHPHIAPAPGHVQPAMGSTAVVASGEIAAGHWTASASVCRYGARAQVALSVRSPTGSRTSATCGAIDPASPPGGTAGGARDVLRRTNRDDVHLRHDPRPRPRPSTSSWPAASSASSACAPSPPTRPRPRNCPRTSATWVLPVAGEQAVADGSVLATCDHNANCQPAGLRSGP